MFELFWIEKVILFTTQVQSADQLLTSIGKSKEAIDAGELKAGRTLSPQGVQELAEEVQRRHNSIRFRRARAASLARAMLEAYHQIPPPPQR